MSFYPPGNDRLYMMTKYTFDNYDVRNYASSDLAAVKGSQIIDGSATYVGLSDSNGVITWQRVA